MLQPLSLTGLELVLPRRIALRLSLRQRGGLLLSDRSACFYNTIVWLNNTFGLPERNLTPIYSLGKSRSIQLNYGEKNLAAPRGIKPLLTVSKTGVLFVTLRSHILNVLVSLRGFEPLVFTFVE